MACPILGCPVLTSSMLLGHPTGQCKEQCPPTTLQGPLLTVDSPCAGKVGPAEDVAPSPLPHALREVEGWRLCSQEGALWHPKCRTKQRMQGKKTEASIGLGLPGAPV